MTMSRRMLLGGLALAAVPLHPRETTPMTLDELEVANENVAAAYMSGIAQLQPLMDHMQPLLQKALEYGRGPRARDAQRLVAWQCALLGVLAAAQGQIPLAKGYATTARTWGKRCGDARVITRSYLAYAQVEMWPGGDPTNAAKLAAEGLLLTSPQDREQYAKLAIILAEAYAKIGNLGGFAEALRMARTAQQRLDVATATCFGYKAQQMHSALAVALADAGDPDAVQHAEIACVRYPEDAPAVRALVEYSRAYALAKTGDPDEAVRVAEAAYTSQKASTWRQKERVRWVLDALPEAYDSPKRWHLRDLVTSP